MNPLLGVIADDITGACDVAAAVTNAGLTAEVRLGVPDPDEAADAQAVIVALKSRTVPAADAVAETLAAARVLRSWGAGCIYQKYCSTFDSTDAGNIGPVADALVDALGTRAVSIGTPATPAAARTVHRGHLFVGHRLLSESSLATHPLTPMTDPDLVRVLGRQTSRRVGLISIEDLRAGATAVRRRIARLRADGFVHLLSDAVDDADLDVLAAAVSGEDDVAPGGAAGLVAALARSIGAPGALPSAPAPRGRPLLVSGSASERTRAQVAAFDGPVFEVRADDAVTRQDRIVGEALEFVASEELPLVSATVDPAEVARAQERWGIARSAEALESALSTIARRAVREHGVRRIVVAGGETSGAVAHALGVRRLRVRRVVSTGVPWMTASTDAGLLDLCFKSGNFGEVGLFRDAWKEPAA